MISTRLWLILALLCLGICACSNPDDRLGEVAFITHSNSEITDLTFRDNLGYQHVPGVMPAPGGLALSSFTSLPIGTSGTLSWKQNSELHSRDIDLESLNIRPPGMLALVLGQNDLMTTFVKYERMKVTEDGIQRGRIILRKFYYDVPEIEAEFKR